MSRVRTGRAGAASLSSQAGDPRARRNAQTQTNDRDVGAGLYIDSRGKLAPKVRLPLVIRDGAITVDIPAFPVAGRVADPPALTGTAATDIAALHAWALELLASVRASGILEG